MSSDVDINAVCRSWRNGVKKKFRGIASFEERAQARFAVIEEALFTRRAAIDGWEYRPMTYNDWGDYTELGPWRSIAVGEQWGQEGPSAFFRATARVPEDFAGQRVMLRLYVGGDSLLTVDGRPWHGIDPFRHDLFLLEEAAGGEELRLECETYAHYHAPRKDHQQAFALAEMAAVDQPVWEAYWDLWCVAKMLQIPDLDERLERFIEYHLWEAMKLVPVQSDDRASLRQAILAAGAAIRQTVYASDRFKGEGRMHFVGHSHLDVVFMWPHKEYLRKVGRTHATMLRLMERYPEFKFSQSQAKIYADMKRCFPQVFEEVKQRVAEGRWEPIGAFWIEPDCNLVSGESFVRQILYGQRFFEREFGLRSRTCWQPDVFGLSWGLPQILAKAGIEYFLTAKMVAWNDTNPWTKHTYWWEGPDGSRVLGITPPGHFIGTVDPDQMDKQWRNYSDKATIGETLHVFGWGDGGGGVDIEMLESAVRYRDFPGLVQTTFSTAEEAFDTIREKVAELPEDLVPVHRDELYLEAHRGSVTTKGRLKKLNRQGEFLLREAEIAASLAWLDGADYPADELDQAWIILLDGQFHDAVPGTHVPEVYVDLKRDYERFFALGRRLRDAAFEHLATAVGAAAGDEALRLWNPTTGARSEAVAVPAELVGEAKLADHHGQVLPQQAVTTLAGEECRLVRVEGVPGCGWRGLTRQAGAVPADSSLTVDERSLENEHLRAEFDELGQLVRLYDKDDDRELVPAGSVGNAFQLFEDMPGRYDAWDIVATYKDHPIALATEAELRVDERGPVRASLRLERRLAGSMLVQRISLAAGSRRLDFETMIDWQERQRLLKVAFPVTPRAQVATYDIAFANIERPTHANASSDAARFEVNCHQWFDLSQYDYGVSLLNDGKYGCDVRDNVLRLTLLKGSIHPDPEADMEVHHFTYSLYPHAGGWRDGGTIAAAAALNQPMLAARCSQATAMALDQQQLVAVDAAGVVLEAVKRADDGDGVIVRLSERHQARVRTELRLPRPISQAWSASIMEEKEAELPVVDGAVQLELAPYEVLTMRLRC